MTDPLTASWLLACTIGFLLGAALSWSGLTPANAIIRAAHGDTRLMVGLVFAAGLSIGITQMAHGFGLVQPERSFHASPLLHWTGMMGGSMLFGVGMALARTDPIAASFRLARGDLHAIALIFIVAIVTLAGTDGILQGPLGSLRSSSIADIGAATGLKSLTLPGIAFHMTETPPQTSGLYGGAIIGGLLVIATLVWHGLWRLPSLLLAGLCAGTALPLLWILAPYETGMPYLVLELPRILAVIMGLSNLTLTPMSGLIIASMVGGTLMTLMPSRNPQPATPQPWRTITGAFAMAIGGVMASGDLISHAVVGLPGFAFISAVCVPLTFVAAGGTSRMLEAK